MIIQVEPDRKAEGFPHWAVAEPQKTGVRGQCTFGAAQCGKPPAYRSVLEDFLEASPPLACGKATKELLREAIAILGRVNKASNHVP